MAEEVMNSSRVSLVLLRRVCKSCSFLFDILLMHSNTAVSNFLLFFCPGSLMYELLLWRICQLDTLTLKLKLYHLKKYSCHDINVKD